MCGKNSVSGFPSNVFAGSPPRVREKRFLSKQATCTSGITPACAGKTSVSCLAGTVTPGSPPRVREKPLVTSNSKLSSGITPASAGKTDKLKTANFEAGDHPRECGKNFYLWVAKDSASGSPPRVREKLLYQISV